MRPTPSLVTLLTATFGLAGALSSAALFAQEQPQASNTVATSAPATPARGSTMENVRSKFGAPSQEQPAVGTPPITRWEYPGYVVFFENDRVLHTVLVK